MCFCGNLLRNKLGIFVAVSIHTATLPMIHSPVSLRKNYDKYFHIYMQSN